MEIVKNEVSIEKIKKMAEGMFGNLVKAVVDIEKGIMVIGGELHADEEAMLLENGSSQKVLWGINIYPDLKGDDWIEFDSMINLRPSQGNRSRSVDDSGIQKQIREIVTKLVKR